MLGNLVPAHTVAEHLVLAGVGGRGGSDRLLDLLRDGLAGPVRIQRRGHGNLRPVDCDGANLHEASLRAHRQHLGEQARQRVRMGGAEPRDRGVVREQVARHNPDATSTWQAVSILWEDTTPVQYAYSNRAAIIDGACAAPPSAGEAPDRARYAGPHANPD